MIKDYTIKKCNLIRGYRWLVFKKINKCVSMQVFGALTKKECEEWVKNNEKRNTKTNKQRNIKANGRTKKDES